MVNVLVKKMCVHFIVIYYSCYFGSGLFRMSLAGFPAQISLSGTSFVITEPAPIIAPRPMVTGLQIIV